MQNEIPICVDLPTELSQLEEIQKLLIDQIYTQISAHMDLNFEQMKDWTKMISCLTQNQTKIHHMKKEFSQPREEAQSSILTQLKQSLHQKPDLLKKLQDLLS